MQISAFSKEISKWSGSLLIVGVLEETIESQINLFKTIIKDSYLRQRFNDAKFEGKKNQKLSIELIEGRIKKIVFIGLGKAENLVINDLRKAASIGTRQVSGYERKLEQRLIQTWLPPFNKETRRIWATPFTSQIN